MNFELFRFMTWLLRSNYYFCDRYVHLTIYHLEESKSTVSSRSIFSDLHHLGIYLFIQ